MRGLSSPLQWNRVPDATPQHPQSPHRKILCAGANAPNYVERRRMHTTVNPAGPHAWIEPVPGLLGGRSQPLVEVGRFGEAVAIGRSPRLLAG